MPDPWRHLDDVVEGAKALLGQTLVRVLDGERLAVRIVETEAYLGVLDKASHSYGGRRTTRTEPMYAEGGTAYVYFTYGMHHCMNVVAGRADDPVAILVRAGEPLEGLETMRRHRGRERPTELASGPARLCQAMAIDRRLTGIDLRHDPRLFLEWSDEVLSDSRIGVGPRVGVAYASEWASRPLRFHDTASVHVSRAR